MHEEHLKITKEEITQHSRECGSQTRNTTSNAQATTIRPRQKPRVWAICAIVGGMVLVVAAVWFLSVPLKPQNGPEGVFPGPLNGARTGLQRDELPLSAVTIRGQWSESDLLFNDTWNRSGSAFVVHESENGHLLLITNAHCLGLHALAQADGGGRVEILSYTIQTEFPTGEVRKVARVAPAVSTDLDLAMFEVRGEGLRSGKDYMIVPLVAESKAMAGDEVIAVGSPFGMSGTVTRGIVSAVRQEEFRDRTCMFYQIDAAVNAGNSGGPLLLKKHNLYRCIGVNTAGMRGAEGLNFAIAVGEAKRARYRWAAADVHGAVNLIEGLYGVAAEVVGNQ